jgi:hypothetical protein
VEATKPPSLIITGPRTHTDIGPPTRLSRKVAALAVEMSDGVASMGLMAQNFLACDREQALLLPPDLRDWLPGDHLAWFVLDVVEELDGSEFLASYRRDGWGRAAFDPAMMVALLLYAYAIGDPLLRRCRHPATAMTSPPNRPEHRRRAARWVTATGCPVSIQ